MQTKPFFNAANYPYKIDTSQILGQGGEGNIYKGYLMQGQKVVAIKQYKDKIKDTELKILKDVQQKHGQLKNQIQILNILEQEKVVIMELADGNLEQLIKTEGYEKLDPSQIICLFLKVVQCLAEFHQLGYFHRDLKPLNILYQGQLGQQINFKLCDYGCAALISERINTRYKGTQQYMAPEVTNQDEDIDTAVDMWSLGVILCYMHRIPKPQNILKISQNQDQIDTFINDQNIQAKSKKLIRKLLRVNPDERIIIEKLINKLNRMIDSTQNKRNFMFYPNFGNTNNQSTYQLNKNEQINIGIQQKQKIYEFENTQAQFQQQAQRAKQIELQNKLKESEEEVEKQLKMKLLKQQRLLLEQREQQEKELKQLQNVKQEHQQKMFQLQMNYNNEIDELKKELEKEAEQKIKEREEIIRQQLQQQQLQEMQQIEKQLKEQIEKEIIEQKNKEYNEELKKRKQEQIRNQQTHFMEQKGIILNLIYISSDMLENYLKSLQQKKADSQNSQNGAEYQQYNQQIEIYIQEANDEIALVQADLAKVQNLNYEQSMNNQIITNYLTQYQQFSSNFSAYQNEKNTNLTQIYQGILNRRSMQEDEKVKQQRQIQQQQQSQIQQLRNQFNQQLEESNKMNQYFSKQFYEKEILSICLEHVDKQQQLSSIINQGKQELYYYAQLNQNFLFQTEDQLDNSGQIQSLQFKIQQLNNQDRKFKELQILLDNFTRVQVQIELEFQITKKKQIDDVLEQIELEIQAFQHQEIQESKQSQQAINLIQSIKEKISHLEQIKSSLSKINLQINPSSINQELQFIKEKKNSAKQYFAQLQKLKEELDRVRAYERLLDQLNQQKIILIDSTKQRVNQQVQQIQNQINIIQKLVNECQFNLDKSGINQKIQNLELIKSNFNSKLQQITMVQQFKVQSEFEQFKLNLEKFIEKNQEIVKAEESSVKDLKNAFQQLMQKEQNESKKLFSQAQTYYESITQNIQEYKRQFDQFQQFPQITQMQDYQQELTLLAKELQQLQNMHQDGIKDQQIITQLIQNTNNCINESTKDKSLDILNNLQRQLIGNIKLLEEKLTYFNPIRIPPNTDYQDLQYQIKKFEQNKEKLEQYFQQLTQSFTKLQSQKGLINENLKLESNQFIQSNIQWESQDKKVIDEQINDWKKFNQKLNKELEFYIITKMIVNQMKLYNARRYAQRLQLDLSKAKKMASAQESKFKDKSLADNKKYQEIINQEQQINTKYKLWLQTNQIMNLSIQNILKEIQDERQQADGYLVDLLNTIKQKNLVKLRKALALKEHIQSVAEYLPKLEFVQGQVIQLLTR